jgi:hypothetical protein
MATGVSWVLLALTLSVKRDVEDRVEPDPTGGNG